MPPLDTKTAHSTAPVTITEPALKTTTPGTDMAVPGSLAFVGAPNFNGTSEPTISSGLATGGVTAPAAGSNSAQVLLDRATQARNLLQQQLGQGTAEPTIGDTLAGTDGFVRPSTDGALSFEDIYGSPIDDDSIRRGTLDMFQQQIDATNEVYDQLLNEERLRGQGRIGSQRAIAARGGILGSDFAGAQKHKVQDFNTQQTRGIQAERTAAIGAILGTARAEAQNEIALKRQARQQGAENYLNFLSSSQERKATNAQKLGAAFASQGIDPTTLDESELSTIASEAGIAAGDIITAYQQSLPELDEAAANDFGFMSTTGGIFRTDPATGEAVFIPSGAAGSAGSSGGSGGSRSSGGSGGKAASFSSFTKTDQQTLLGGGWSRKEIDVLAQGIEEYGLQEVIKQERAAGATPTQIKALEDAYGVEATASQDSSLSLNKDYFKSLYSMDTLEELAAASGFTKGGFLGIGVGRGPGEGVDQYLDSLVSMVEQYRQAGFSDKEILELMGKD